MSFIAVFGQLLPLMVAVALSTIPISVIVTILLTPNSARSALMFMIGLLVGMFAVTGLLALGLSYAPDRVSLWSASWVGWIEVLIGIPLIVYGIRTLVVRRRRPSVMAEDQMELPRWLRVAGNIRPVPALGLGLLLNLRPKALLLSAAAGLILATSRLSFGEAIAELVIFVIVGGSTVAVPAILALANPKGMRGPLQRADKWIARNSQTTTVVVALLIGTVILGDGLTKL